MKLSLWIALKYFYSKKVRNVINTIARVSQLGIIVGTFALIVILSVFNGFEDVIISLYNSFDPDIKITATDSKYFLPDSSVIVKFSHLDGIAGYSGVIEENALLKYKNNQTIVTLKGINPEFLHQIGLDSMVRYGEPMLVHQNYNFILLGSGIASKLEVALGEDQNIVTVYYPKKENPGAFSFNPENAFNQKPINPAGVFAIQSDFDNKYAVVPLKFIREVVDQPSKVTAIEIILKPGYDTRQIKNNLKQVFGVGYEIKDRFEQHKWLYKITRSEKFIVFLILSLILLIAAFNLIGSLLMLSIEKKKDMMILKSMGAEPKLIRNIFFIEGILLSLSGAVVGIILGAIVSLLQQKYGFVKINGGSTFLLDSYPVSFRFFDFIKVFGAALVIGIISSWIPARAAYRELTIKDINN
jgi:lipoprotein-releasing system permease protein